MKDEWVNQNFEEPFLRQAKCSTGYKNPFLHVPPGDSKSHKKVNPTKGPKLHYRQMEGERTCMVYAMASALFEYGYKDIASMIYNSRKRFMNDANGMHQLCRAMGKESKAFRHFTMDKHKPPDYLGDTLTGRVVAKL